MRADLLGYQHRAAIAPAWEYYQGVLVANTGYSPSKAEQAIAAGAVESGGLFYSPGTPRPRGLHRLAHPAG